MNEEKFESGLNHWGGALPFNPDRMEEDNDILEKFMLHVAQYLVPTGTISAFGGSSAPDGFLICNGQAANRIIHAKLFAVIGTIYGVGDGTTTFNVPDLRDRFPLGSNANLGTLKGSNLQTLVTGELPSHAHPTQIWNGAGSGPLGAIAPWGPSSNIPGQNLNALPAGGGEPHNNIPASICLIYIIKF